MDEVSLDSRLIAIGDVHGCLAALEAVVGELAPRPEDELVLLGDYVDRGPDSRGVIDYILGLRDRCQLVTLLGNHEEMMLNVLQKKDSPHWWLKYGGVETLDSYDFTGDMSVVPAEHVAFLEACDQYHATDDFLFFHANYVADETPENQPAEALRWQSLGEHLPEPHQSGRTAIVGHTSQKSGEILDAGHLRCIDTYCYGGGWLTAMEVRSGDVWQVDRAGRPR